MAPWRHPQAKGVPRDKEAPVQVKSGCRETTIWRAVQVGLWLLKEPIISTRQPSGNMVIQPFARPRRLRDSIVVVSWFHDRTWLAFQCRQVEVLNFLRGFKLSCMRQILQYQSGSIDTCWKKQHVQPNLGNYGPALISLALKFSSAGAQQLGWLQVIDLIWGNLDHWI